MPHDTPLSDRLIRNTLFNSAGRFWELAVSLFLAPYIIHHLGIERYGIWVIVFSLIYFIGFCDFSIQTPLIKYVAEYFSQNNIRQFNRLISTTLVYYLGLSLLIIGIGLPAAPAIARLFSMQPSFISETLTAVQFGIILFAVMNQYLFWIAVLKGLQYMDIENKIIIAASIVRVLGTVIALEQGFGLKGLMIVSLIEMLFGLILAVVVTKRKLPWMTLTLLGFDLHIFKKLFLFGATLHIGKIAFLISFHFDKLIIARWVSLSAVGFYELGAKILFTARRISSLVVSALLPAVSDADGRRDEKLLNELYNRSVKYLAIVSCFLFVFLFFHADLVLSAWLKGSYPEAAAILRILSIGYFFNTFVTVLSTFAVGIGKPGLEMKYSLLMVPLNTAASIILVILFGLKGAAIGTTVSLTIGTGYFLWILHTNTSIFQSGVLKTIKIPFISALIAGLSTLPLYQLSLASPVYSSRTHDIIALLLHSSMYSLLFIVLILSLGIFDHKDRNVIINKILKPFCTRNTKKT